jgi:hypothetical protein
VDIDGFFVQGETGERIHHEVVKLLVYVPLDILAQHLVLSLFLQFERILDVPCGCKNTQICTGHAFYSLGDFLMLEVEGLDWPGDEVVTADQLLLVLLVFLVLLADLLILELVRGGGQAESEDSRCLLKQHIHVLLQIVDSQFFVLLL